MKRIVSVALVLAMLLTVCGCSNMPFNGDITFHEVALTVPDRFVRDSTESNEDFWIFERDGYEEYILLNRNDKTTDDILASLTNYVMYMEENGAVSERTTFMGNEAVHTTYYLEKLHCHEILFFYNESFYSIALRGGSPEDFDAILATVELL